MSSIYPDLALPQPIPYVPVCIPPAVQFEDQPVLEEVGKGKTHQSQKNVCLLTSTIYWITSFAKLIFYPVDLVCTTFFLLVNVCKGISFSWFAASKTATQVIANVVGRCINMLAHPAVHLCLRAARYQSQNTMSARIKSRTTSWRSRFSFELPRNSLTDCFTSLRALRINPARLQWHEAVCSVAVTQIR